MRSSNRSLDSTPTIQTLLGALRDLRHAIERAYTHPEFARDRLPYVLDTAGSRLVGALTHNGRDAEAKTLARVMTDAKELGSAEAVTALLAEADRLLICLPLDTQPVTQRQRTPLAEAEPRIRAYLKRHPDAKRPKVARVAGCAEATVQKSKPWKAKVAKRKAKRGPSRTKVGLDMAIDEPASQLHREAEIDTLIEEQERDMRSNH